MRSGIWLDAEYKMHGGCGIKFVMVTWQECCNVNVLSESVLFLMKQTNVVLSFKKINKQIAEKGDRHGFS